MRVEKTKVLFLGGGPSFINSIPFKEKFKSLSRYFIGHVLTPVAGVREVSRTQIGNFLITGFPYVSYNALARNVYTFYMLITLGRRLFRELSYDVVVSPNPLTSGMAGLVLARTTGTKLIIEVNGNFESAFKYGRLGESQVRPTEALKDKLAKRLIRYILPRADTVKLVHSKQLDPLCIEKDTLKVSVFPNFVPIKCFIESPKSDRKYILLLGYPWYLKGVDTLIKAFKKISSEFPEYSLKIVGWCPKGREYFEDLASGHSKIELHDPVEYEQVIKLMSECSLYVLASRTDSSPRVLREAMASKKPIIASNIDGVPELIKDGYNGLLFEKENIDDLCNKIRLILSDQTLARRLAENGFQYVQERLSEEDYLRNYHLMVQDVLR